MIGRRRFLGVLAGTIAAPIIVRPGLIMPIREKWTLPQATIDVLPGAGDRFDAWVHFQSRPLRVGDKVRDDWGGIRTIVSMSPYGWPVVA